MDESLRRRTEQERESILTKWQDIPRESLSFPQSSEQAQKERGVVSVQTLLIWFIRHPLCPSSSICTVKENWPAGGISRVPLRFVRERRTLKRGVQRGHW